MKPHGHTFLHTFLKMRTWLYCILVLLCCFTCGNGEFISGVKDPEGLWNTLAKLERRIDPGPMPKAFRSGSQTWKSSEPRVLPDFVAVSSDMVQKSLFKPEIGARPLPPSVKQLFFPVVPTEPPSTENKLFEILCHQDRIYARVRRDYFKTLGAHNFLKLGTCPVNQATATHYYFLYFLTSDCDFTRESHNNHLLIQNYIRYDPTTTVLRELPFNVSIHCNYQRFFNSYRGSIRPKLIGGTLFKSLRRKHSFILEAQDALGMKLAQAYVLGEPMYFVAKQADGTHISADERIYINQCFITSSLVPSSPKHVVIDNHGCMVEGKESAAARFLAGPSRLTQRFTMNAVLVHGISYTPSTKHLYMHCDVTVGKHPQSEHFKACNYDPGTKTWKELYGYDSVCACCKSTCSHGPHLRASRNMVTSQPWNVNAEDLKMKKLANIETDDEDMIIEWNKLEDDY